jgi:hypothetical protein
MKGWRPSTSRSQVQAASPMNASRVSASGTTSGSAFGRRTANGLRSIVPSGLGMKPSSEALWSFHWSNRPLAFR